MIWFEISIISSELDLLITNAPLAQGRWLARGRWEVFRVLNSSKVKLINWLSDRLETHRLSGPLSVKGPSQPILNNLGSGCSTPVEQMIRDREVVGSDHTRYWAFFYSPLSYQYCILNQVLFEKMLSRTAWGEASMDWAKTILDRSPPLNDLFQM